MVGRAWRSSLAGMAPVRTGPRALTRRLNQEAAAAALAQRQFCTSGPLILFSIPVPSECI